MQIRSFALALLALTLGVPLAHAQKDDHPHHRRAESVPVHAGSTPAIKALSADEVAGLLEGQGMGLARAAELNGYPGPLHVLELADSLALTPQQRATAETLRAEVVREAPEIGARLVAEEEALDAVFAQERATPALVDAITAKIGGLQGELRAVHLRTHIAMRAALTPEQIATYNRLRGYTD